ncbi:MAG: hypothetical protein U0625_03930 [Phycisphaerales bacterium]
MAAGSFGSIASAGITAIGPADFSGAANVVTFDEVAVGTSIPFTVGLAQFGGLGGTTSDFGAFGAPPAPSGVPYLQSNSVENDDVVEVVFGAAQSSVGAYFDTASNLFEGGSLRMEFYAGDTLLGILAAVPVGDTFGGWVGGTAGEAVITRVIFREMDADTPISFRIDDLTFEIPGPHVLGCLAVGGLCRGARRRRG